MYIDRETFAEEMKLRKLIRESFKVVKSRRENDQLEQEKVLRMAVRKMIIEAVSDVEDSPHRSTGINVLEDLLKKIVPVIEIDFKKLTTSEEQRTSYKAHILNAVENSLATARVMDDATIEEQETIDIDIQDDDKFIDVRGEEEPEEEEQSEAESEGFAIAGEDETGRDMAYTTFKSIESNILDAFNVLSNNEDKRLFYDYLITNLKLYFDKFEEEMSVSLEMPTTPEYEKASKENEEDTIEDLDGLEFDEDEEELDLEDIANM